ncbi:MAG: GNAT family N-acetyltransferase [Ardenticatenaceae bacterium]|nr:GNAT family N-acetyltransferase [Ardenticatenaceae bacterium]MCB9444537.1 GNAT family N-acetyltransferase [Ardenticatenaceae bacterium]
MSFQLRELKEGDLPEVATLTNEVSLFPTTLSDLIDWYNRQPEGHIRRLWVAVDSNRQIVGYSKLFRSSWDEAGLFNFDITVKPERQGQGLGSRLYDDAFATISTFNVKKLKAFVRDDRPDCLHFAQNRGFTIQRHSFGSTIDLAEFDERPFTGLVESLEAGGIHFASLADMGDTEDARRTLHAALTVITRDVPGEDRVFSSFEEFNEWIKDGFWPAPSEQIMAIDGDKCVGVAILLRNNENNSLGNFLTGVLPAYRGHKVAQALKLVAIRYGKTIGANYIYTTNDSVNAPMLAINRKLGYKPQPGGYLLYKQL